MYRVGIIGCGRPHKTEGATGFAMSRAHAEGYRASADAEIVALADIKLDNAQAFQAVYGGDKLYTDYRAMLAQEKLDIVSISTWPHLHAEMVIAAAEAGVKAVHCEKPMAPTYGEAVRMVRACEANGVQLTINHQRRFGAPFRQAKELVKQGVIGELQRVEAVCDNLYDWGTHWFDMMFFYNDQTPVEWVIGQVDARGSHNVFDVLVEGQGLSHFRFQNGVIGQLVTGYGTKGFVNRLIGSDGMIEVGYSPEIPLRVRGVGDGAWRNVDVGEGIHGVPEYVARGVLDLIDALKTGREPELAGRRALQGHRVDLCHLVRVEPTPKAALTCSLTVEDSPFLSMVEEGLLPTAE